MKAVVVLKPGTTATGAEIIATARQRLPSYQKPKSVDFVASLPKAPTGKVIKRELRAPYWADQERT
ncbi:AMP-binding enzyme [Saccharopolyspora gregorii]|uniref:AMP-binding enzyme n=1 Tax=Saccharopolyspora gregorii TaxID=33914 RepID=UPI0031EEB224